MNFRKHLLYILFIPFLVACSKPESHFIVEGNILQAENSTLYFGERKLKGTEILDSVKLSKEGNFSFEGIKNKNPEFYVLQLNNQAINLVVDSTTNLIKIRATESTLASNYIVEGSNVNKQLQDVVSLQQNAEKDFADLEKKYKEKRINQTDFFNQKLAIDSTYKSAAQTIILENPASSVAYFSLFQKTNGTLIFDPYSDYKFFAAVATAWDMYYPTSERTKQLKDITLQAIKLYRINRDKESKIDSIKQLSVSKFLDINLPSVYNDSIALSSIKNKNILLDFTTYQAEASPVHNMILNKIYTKYKDQLEVYQISFDNDLHFWKNAASNLPWIAVHDDRQIQSPLLHKYNVHLLPTSFLINKNGEIIKRLTPQDNIESAVTALCK